MIRVSYSQLSKLAELVGKYWNCFAPYLPPRDLWDAKLKEVLQIRHRVAHFRTGHADDYARLLQFMRDIDRGFWTFCTSYNNAHPILPPSKDPVTAHFLHLDPLPWAEVEPNTWGRFGSVDKSLVIGMTVAVQCRPWETWRTKVDGVSGFLYDLVLTAHDDRKFDYSRFLKQTTSFHFHLVHVCLATFENSVRFTIPALLGSAKVIEIVQEAVEIAGRTVNRSRNPIAPPPQAVADEWPEYVLGPKNPLTFLDPGMKCSFFTV
jgi:hypothetical protein